MVAEKYPKRRTHPVSLTDGPKVAGVSTSRLLRFLLNSVDDQMIFNHGILGTPRRILFAVLDQFER